MQGLANMEVLAVPLIRVFLKIRPYSENVGWNKKKLWAITYGRNNHGLCNLKEYVKFLNIT